MQFLSPRRLGLGALLLVLGTTSTSLADRSIIRQPGNRTKYALELEPHLLVGIWNPPGGADDDGFGLGVRASFPVVDNGFVATINNSVAIGVGLDLLYYEHAYRGYCVRVAQPGQDRFLCGTLGQEDAWIAWMPVVMQWSFWLSENWSVFGEPGLALRYMERDSAIEDDSDLDFDPFVFYVGGRYHFADTVTLTLRAGWPTFSVGASFLL